jgi:CRP-like cAMP-binding protein
MEKSDLQPGHLRRIKSLAPLDDSQLSRFLAFIDVVELPRLGSLFREGQPGDSMFLILEGQVRVFTRQRDDDAPLMLRRLEAGDSFGEISLLTQASRSATVEATQATVLLRISAAALGKLAAEEPALAAHFLHSVAATLGRQLTDLTAKLRMRSEQFEVLTHSH